MKNLYTLLITILFITLFVQQSGAQDPRFTQAYSNPLRVNPAIMGANSDLKFVLNYRNQWGSIGKGFVTSSVTGMFPLFLQNGKNKLDIGVSAMSDKAGAFTTSEAALAFDYNLQIAENNYVSFALMAGFIQKSLNVSNQTFDNQYVLGSYNPSNPTGEGLANTTKTLPDLGFGLMWYLNPDVNTSTLNAYAGFSAFHLNRPNESLLGANSPLPVRYSGQAGIKVLGGNKVDLSPNFRLTVQNGNTETALGLLLDYNFTERMKLVVGGWYRTHDAAAVLIGFDHKNFSFGYSYDLINTTLKNTSPTPNAHELSIAIKIGRSPKSKDGANSSSPPTRVSPVSSF